jgi:phosphate transport system substrate-binding protein
MAADTLRIELANGQVIIGKLVGTTPRDLLLDVPGSRGPTTVARTDIRRFAVVAPAQAAALVQAAPPLARAARLPVGERTGMLRLSGANSMGVQLLPALLTDYGAEAGLVGMQEEMTSDPAVRIVLLQGAESTRRLQARIAALGSAAAFTDLATGQADIGMSTRRATDAEARALLITGPGGQARVDNEVVVGLSGVVVLVHRDNPLRALSVAQLRDLFSGAAARWPGAGGLPVTVYALDQRSGEFNAVQERILGTGARLSPKARLFVSNEDLADAVAADPAAIGFVGAGYVGNARAVTLQQECGLGGEPSAFNLKTEEYPLSRRLFLYATARATPLARDLLAYGESARAQTVLAKSGFINLEPLLGSAEQSTAQIGAIGAFLPDEMKAIAAPQADALRQMVQGARRLSVTFRFEAGRADLDPRAEADLGRLANWKNRPENAQSSLLLVGHASIDGVYATNLELSRARANAVAARLRQAGLAVAQVEGVGPVNQVVCNRSVAESDMNRRVEVWIR